MAEEKKTEGEKTKGTGTPGQKLPIVTRSMIEESCPTCEAEPEIPKVLPDANWSTEKLVEATKDKNLLTRSNAVMLLGKRNPDVALEPLIEALKDKEYIVKTNAMVAISAFGKQVLDRMITALDDADPDVRAGAAWVLGEFKDPKSIEHLQRVANDEYPLARIQAKASLMAMGVGVTKESKKEKTTE
jgi:HEAT repeat protein